MDVGPNSAGSFCVSPAGSRAEGSRDAERTGPCPGKTRKGAKEFERLAETRFGQPIVGKARDGFFNGLLEIKMLPEFLGNGVADKREPCPVAAALLVAEAPAHLAHAGKPLLVLGRQELEVEDLGSGKLL